MWQQSDEWQSGAVWMIGCLVMFVCCLLGVDVIELVACLHATWRRMNEHNSLVRAWRERERERDREGEAVIDDVQGVKRVSYI